MNLYQSGLTLAILGPLAVYFLGQAGFSDICTNEIVQIAPTVVGVVMAHIHSWKSGHVSLGGRAL